MCSRATRRVEAGHEAVNIMRGAENERLDKAYKDAYELQDTALDNVGFVEDPFSGHDLLW